MQQPPKPVPPPEFQEKEIATLGATALLAILQDAAATEFRRAKACVRLGELGAVEAVPALAALLSDPHLSVYARYGLEPIADPAAADALRAALPRLKGDALIGVVNSLNKRRDARSIPALGKMLHGPDTDLARAAAAALGSIGTEAAMKDLQAALSKSAGLLRMAIADACLVCAERLIADGKRDTGMALYAALSRESVPKPARLAAMSAIVREETSIQRPR